MVLQEHSERKRNPQLVTEWGELGSMATEAEAVGSPNAQACVSQVGNTEAEMPGKI